MKYILLIDNDVIACKILKELLYSRKNESEKYDDYNIIAYYGFDSSNNIDWVEKTNEVVAKTNELLIDENEVHLFIDLLLTEYEENNLEQILTNESIVLSEIKLAISILSGLNRRENLKITFMSRWLRLSNESSARHFNGMQDTVWDSLSQPCSWVFNPINEEHDIVDLQLTVPQNGAIDTVGAFLNLAFNEQESEV